MDQYVILPKKENGELLEKYEILIYVCIRKYMNKDTMEAFPSLDTIVKDSGCSKPTVRKMINNIKKKGYFVTTLLGKCTKYKFSNEKLFEPFSYEFLNRNDITKSEKLQILCCQQYMYKNDGVGKISMSDSELSKLTGLDRHVISRNNMSLMDKGFMTQISLRKRNKETGVTEKETIYHLNELGQAIVFAIQNHEERLQEQENVVEKLKEKSKKQSQDISLLFEEINRLKKENEELRGINHPASFAFQ